MASAKPGRRKPYTARGIRRVKCARCGDPARFQWQICADGNLYRPICLACDVALNAIVLAFMGFDNVTDRVMRYANAKALETQ